MPIKPENKSRYPKDWPEIRDRILKRAGHRCEHPGCCAEQYAVGRWERKNSIWVWRPISGNGPCDAAGQGREWPSMNRLTYTEARQFAADADWEREHLVISPLIVIVLTIAHLDHQPENCADDNLAAMCQRHHLAYDHEHHKRNAQATRRAKAGTLELFA